jgi:transketolase
LKQKNDQHSLKDLSKEIRKVMLKMGYASEKAAHFGGGLSMVEILTSLYGEVLNYKVDNPRWVDRDRFILSKGHGVLGFYATLYVFGFIGKKEIDSFQQNESEFISHPIMNLDYGIESSNGSLGHGLALGAGVAMSAKLKNKNFNVYVMLGDGECNEGSIWEAAMFAYHHRLNNLVVIVDRNSMQNDGESKDVMGYFSIEDAWKGFGWDVRSIDGHNHKELCENLIPDKSINTPKVIIANTIKGKGISFMEGVPSWHHGKLTDRTFKEAFQELGGID